MAGKRWAWWGGWGLLVLAMVVIGIRIGTWLGAPAPDPTTSLNLTAPAAQALAEDGMTTVAGFRAPNFRLQNQRGQTVQMSQFRGRVVVLTFLDPVCWYQCPLQAQDLKLMWNDLPARDRARVELVAIVANPVVYSEAAVQAFDRAEQMNGLPTWQFLTDPNLAVLRQVWHDYYVAVSAPRNGMVNHSQVFYLIGRTGSVRYVSNPADTPGAFDGTAQLLAAYVLTLLGQSPTALAPAASTPTPMPLPFSGRIGPAWPRGNQDVHRVTAADAWRLTTQGAYEVLQRTTDRGRVWTNVSPPGVTKRGGMVVAYGAPGQAWAMVLPWGYTESPVTFYTDDWGKVWTSPDVLPPDDLFIPVRQPLAAGPDGVAVVLTRSGLLRSSAGGPWRPMAPAPPAVPAGAVVTLGRNGRIEVTGSSRGAARWIWEPGRRLWIRLR